MDNIIDNISDKNLQDALMIGNLLDKALDTREADPTDLDVENTYQLTFMLAGLAAIAIPGLLSHWDTHGNHRWLKELKTDLGIALVIATII